MDSDEKNQQLAITATSTFLGVIIFLAGAAMLLFSLLWTLLGSRSYEICVWPELVLLVLGMTMILYPRGYRARYLVGAALLLPLSTFMLYVRYVYIPDMKAIKEEIENGSDEPSGGLDPTSVDFPFYENLALSIAIVCIAAGLFLIVLYLKPDLLTGKTKPVKMIKRKKTGQ
jgi:hypothetical protein